MKLHVHIWLCLTVSVVIADALPAAEKTILSSEYLSETSFSGHRLTLFQDSELKDGPAILIVDPNGCSLNQFGDPEICTLIAPTAIKCELKAIKLADPLKLGRVVYDIIIPGSTSQNNLIASTDPGIGFRLVISDRSGHRQVIPLLKRSIESQIAFGGPGGIPIIDFTVKGSGSGDQIPVPLNGSGGILSTPEGTMIITWLKNRVNYEFVSRVRHVCGEIRDSSVLVTAVGDVPTSGWANAKLEPFIYVIPPLDGIYDFQFVAEKPGGITQQVVTPIEVKDFKIALAPKMKGIRVGSATNSFLLRFLETPEIPKPIDQFQVISARLKDGCLDVDVTFAGGCARHDFTLHWDNTFKKSNPPIAVMRLIHDGNEDPCEGLERETLHFALPQLQPCIIRVENQFGDSFDVHVP